MTDNDKIPQFHMTWHFGRRFAKARRAFDLKRLPLRNLVLRTGAVVGGITRLQRRERLLATALVRMRCKAVFCPPSSVLL